MFTVGFEAFVVCAGYARIDVLCRNIGKIHYGTIFVAAGELAGIDVVWFQWSRRLRLRRSFKFLCAGLRLDNNAESVYGLGMDYTGQLHLDSDAKQCYIYSELFDSMYFE